MIDYVKYIQIKHAYEILKLSATQIAKEFELDVRTIQKWIEMKNYQARKNIPRDSKLDMFKKQIQAMIEKHPYSSMQVFQMIQEQGYTGGKSILNKYIFKIRPPQRSAYLTLSFAPGECAQVDWGHYGYVQVGEFKRKLYFFVIVLCYSRMMYVEFSLSQSMEFFLGCHENAFAYFKGIPDKIMIDNLKTGVLQHRYGEPPIFNPTYVDYANHNGFKIIACNVGKGNEKGTVENGVRYVKCNYLNGKEISDYKILNPSIREWLDTLANVRIHGETHKKPIELFEVEKKSLNPININPYDIGQPQTIRSNTKFRINFESNRYSVPYKYSSQLLILKKYPSKLCVFKDHEIIAEHMRSFEKYKDFENSDHVVGLLEQKKKGKEQKIFLRFLNLSPKSELYYHNLEERRLNPKVHIQKIVNLSEIYGVEQVRIAIETAIELSAYSSCYIENLIEQRERAKSMQEPENIHLIRNEYLLDLEIPEPNLDSYKNEEGLI